MRKLILVVVIMGLAIASPALARTEKTCTTVLFIEIGCEYSTIEDNTQAIIDAQALEAHRQAQQLNTLANLQFLREQRQEQQQYLLQQTLLTAQVAQQHALTQIEAQRTQQAQIEAAAQQWLLQHGVLVIGFVALIYWFLRNRKPTIMPGEPRRLGVNDAEHDPCWIVRETETRRV